MVTLINITEENMTYTYSTTANATSLTTPNKTSLTLSDLVQGANYSFTVTGIDTYGRLGEESLPSDVVAFDSKALRKHHPTKAGFINL